MKQVPLYEVKFNATPKNKYCVVIPVINEGERLHNLLLRMKKEKVSSIADIIIVDGGSNDGSLDFEKLINLEVSALLLKTGDGKLSAQLLCAYDFLLDKKYDGVVTIDGNNKDDPKDISVFIEKLKSGVDFVQASRFLEGGESKNTPLIRWFAIRCLHAPILSIFSGFKWTDTTQGFRAYSAKLLMSERLNIFRNIFNAYELLAYLNYAAPRLGFVCQEVPTKRVYPSGAIPTKINGFKGNLFVFLTLLRVCKGDFNAKSEEYINES
jgi:dolichol-phosphate mannosyltransferase